MSLDFFIQCSARAVVPAIVAASLVGVAPLPVIAVSRNAPVVGSAIHPASLPLSTASPSAQWLLAQDTAPSRREPPSTPSRTPYSRTTLFGFLIVMSLIPVLATFGVWLLLGKLEARANAYLDEMTKLKADAVVQLQGLMDDAQSVLEGVRDRLETRVDASSLAQIEGVDSLDGSVNLENLATMSAGANGQSAIPSAEAAGVISPEDYCRRGNALFLSGDYAEAVDAYDRALALKPDYYQAWSNRGSALFNLEQYDASIASYDRALDLKDDYPEAWNNRGSSLIKLGDYSAAAFSFERACDLKADYLDAWNNRGFALMQLDRHKEALSAYVQVTKLDPSSAQAWHDRGRATLQLQRYGQALQCFDQTITIAPGHLGAWRDRAVALEQLGRANDAYKALSQALLLDPEVAELWTARGDINYNRKRYLEAIEDYDRALELGEQPDLWFRKACCYAASGETKPALNWLAKAIHADAAFAAFAVDEPTLDSLHAKPAFQALVGDFIDEAPESTDAIEPDNNDSDEIASDTTTRNSTTVES